MHLLSVQVRSVAAGVICAVALVGTVTLPPTLAAAPTPVECGDGCVELTDVDVQNFTFEVDAVGSAEDQLLKLLVENRGTEGGRVVVPVTVGPRRIEQVVEIAAREKLLLSVPLIPEDFAWERLDDGLFLEVTVELGGEQFQFKTTVLHVVVPTVTVTATTTVTTSATATSTLTAEPSTATETVFATVTHTVEPTPSPEPTPSDGITSDLHIAAIVVSVVGVLAGLVAVIGTVIDNLGINPIP
ncbi:MAG: hypothetical protein SPI77_03905 [Corynebacterium sp.]|nr:hypothetical protein [Corynebacterium sp.]